MIPLLAIQAAEKKATFSSAVMTGNYECAYVCGALSKINNLSIESIDSLDDLKKTAGEILKCPMPTEPRSKRFQEMLSEYEIGKIFDSQVQELFDEGRKAAVHAT